MFPKRYFAARLFAPHYYTEVGANPVSSNHFPGDAPGDAEGRIYVGISTGL